LLYNIPLTRSKKTRRNCVGNYLDTSASRLCWLC